MAGYDSGYEAGMAYWDEGWLPGEDGPDDEGEAPWIALPHQCSDWKIGSVDQAKQLIADLEALIANEQG
jgi:hypothetical protein